MSELRNKIEEIIAHWKSGDVDHCEGCPNYPASKDDCYKDIEDACSWDDKLADAIEALVKDNGRQEYIRGCEEQYELDKENFKEEIEKARTEGIDIGIMKCANLPDTKPRIIMSDTQEEKDYIKELRIKDMEEIRDKILDNCIGEDNKWEILEEIVNTKINSIRGGE